MKKLFTFLCAALMSVGMYATSVVTITQNDFPGMDVSFTKDGVTVSADWIDNMDSGHLVGPGSFSTTLGNFTKIEVNAGEFVMPLGEGWSGNSERQTWTGNASSVSFSGEINGVGHGITIMCTIEEPAPTTYTLQLVADQEKGSVAVTNLLGSDIIDNGNGNYTVPENAEVTILATPLDGYEFTGWKVGNRWCDFTECGTALNTLDNPLTFTMTEDVAYKAEFAAAAPAPAEVTVVFAANDKTVERTVTLPHTFKCNWQMGMDGPDELDNIIHELYNDYYYCNNNINASGSDQVEAGTGENDNDFITIKGVFEGTATVTGDYANPDTDTGLQYTLTISIKGDEPAPDFAGEGTEASPYLIASAEDWNKLATNVNGGNTYNGEYFQLTDNIAISTMVGLSDHNFNGTFDGAGHTITATLSSDADCCAPFAYTYGATIKNLHVTGTLTATGTHAGGVVGRNGSASLTLINVSSSMTIIANATNSNGGLVGYAINATLSGCAFTGKLLTEQNRRLGGMVGWKSNTADSYLTITDCVFDPEEVTIGNSGSKTFAAYGGGTVTFTNCYYTQAISADQGKQMRAITAGEGVLVLNTGSATIYNVSGITSYGTGISYNNVLYGGNGDEISLNLSGSNNGYEASTGTLSGTENPYTLTMADADCQINKLAPTPTAVENVQTNPVQATKILRDGMLLIVRDGKLFNVTGAQVR